MAKTKTPFFGLGSRGTVGNALTTQARNGITMVREKPSPVDPYTLAQAYHRWDYEDYSYLWHDLSPADKSAWRAIGSKKRMTGFNAYMSYKLKTLPGLLGRWHLDEESGLVAHDSSHLLHHGTIYGPLRVQGIIGTAFDFDGVDDYVEIPDFYSPYITVELFHTSPIDYTAYRIPVGKATGGVPAGFEYELRVSNTGKLDFIVSNGTNYISAFSTASLVKNTWYHLAGTFDGLKVRVYINGVLAGTPQTLVGTINNTTSKIRIGKRTYGTAYPTRGIIDEVRISNIPLDAAELLRHSERRYP